MDTTHPAPSVSTLSGRTLLLLTAFAPTTGLSGGEITQDGRKSYARFLQATHAYIRASVPLMEEARARLAPDPAKRHVVDYLTEHISEEQGHDDWILEDLRSCDLSDDVVDVALIPEIWSAVGAQYYHVRHGNPLLFFAYVLALESSPPDPRLIQHVLDETGLSESAVRNLREHQELDSGSDGHAARLAEVIDSFDLDDGAQKAFHINALQTSASIHVAVRKALALPS